MSMITRKWITDNAINGSKLRLDNNQALRALSSSGNPVDVLKVNTSDKIEFGSLPQAAGNPLAGPDLVNLDYLKSYVEGMRDPKDAARVAAPVNITIASPGAVIDGVSLVVNDRVLLVTQDNKAENGLYLYKGPATPMVRSSDANSDAEVTSGMSVVITDGDVNNKLQFVLKTADPITLGTTQLDFVSFPFLVIYTGGDMIQKTGSTFTVDLASVSGLESSNPGNDLGQLRIRPDDAALPQHRTTKISASNALVGLKSGKELISVDSQIVSQGYVDLSQLCSENSVQILPIGGPTQTESVDFSCVYAGGSGKTRVQFMGDLASLLAPGDFLQVSYRYL